MKKIFTTLLITILLLSSCSVDWNDEKDKRISELEKQVKEDIFKKKQECFTYRDNIKKEYSGTDEFVADMFYSPKINSCVFRVKVLKSTDNILIDYFSREELSFKKDSCYLENGQSDELCLQQQKNFNDKLKELKGE